MPEIISRRGLILGAAALLAVPAIVRASSLMKVRGVILDPSWDPPLPIGVPAEWRPTETKIIRMVYRILTPDRVDVEIIPATPPPPDRSAP